jgi:hypothetical protein
MNGKKRWAESGAFCLLHIIDRGSGHTGRGMGLLHGAFLWPRRLGWFWEAWCLRKVF